MAGQRVAGDGRRYYQGYLCGHCSRLAGDGQRDLAREQIVTEVETCQIVHGADGLRDGASQVVVIEEQRLQPR